MLALTNRYLAVLDTCVLAPMPICDTFLRLAEEPAFYVPKWSACILDELERTLIKFGYSAKQAKRRTEQMTAAFEDALVTDYEALTTAMVNHPKGRHVLAAAVKCKAHAIVTDNTKDFPDLHLKPYGIEVITPDNFLIHQYHFDRDQVTAVLEQQAAKIKRDLPALLTLLSRNTPKFAALMRAR
jgi:predicted nucleic acid-binding protein